MNIITEEVEFCKLKVQYEADNDLVGSKREEVISKFRSQKVPGFRPGHATTDAIKQHFRKEINELLKQELAEDAVHSVIAEKNIKPFGRPIFSSVSLEDSYLINISGQSALPKFKCEFMLHTQPEFELKEYKNFDLPKPAGILSAEDLSQRMLQDLRTKYGNTVPYAGEDFVQMGDTVIVDIETSSDGAAIPELTGQGEILNVGRITIPGFSESILGMKPEETREFDLNMGEAFREEFANKSLHFKVRLSMGSKMEPAALNDELATKIGAENFDKLMENVRSTASSRVKELESNQLIDQISKRLIENHDFSIPQWISLAEAQINARNAGQDWDTIPDEEKTKYIDVSEKSIKLSLILQKIRENEPDAQLTDEETFNLARQNLAKYSPEPDKVMGEIYKNGHLPVLFARIKDEHTLGFIERNSKIIE